MGAGKRKVKTTNIIGQNGEIVAEIYDGYEKRNKRGANQHKKTNRSLTYRQRAAIVKGVKNLTEGGKKTATEVAISSGYSSSSSSSVFSSAALFRSSSARKMFNDLLGEAGLTDQHLAERFYELSQATRSQVILGEEREVEALDTQVDVLKFVAKLKGHLVERRENVDGPLSGLPRELVQLIYDRLSALAQRQAPEVSIN